MRFVNNDNGVYVHGVSFAGAVDVVDRSSFRPDSERVRALKVNPASGESSTPKYDYNDGQVPKDDPVSDIIVALRSGRLDKADVDALKRSIREEVQRSADDARIKKVNDKMSEILGLNESSDKDSSDKA